MDKLDECDGDVAHHGSATLSEADVEAVTADERRRIFEALGAAAVDPRVPLDARLLQTLGHEVVDPRGEVFTGEGQALVDVIIDEQDGHVFAARVLAQAAIEVAAMSEEGTRAGRVALLRCIAGFLLHDRCSRRALAMRVETAATRS